MNDTNEFEEYPPLQRGTFVLNDQSQRTVYIARDISDEARKSMMDSTIIIHQARNLPRPLFRTLKL